MWNFILLLWSCIHISVVVGAPDTVTGHRGERVEIRCSYEPGYESNSKYLCKGECKYVPNKNIIVKSGSPAKDERFSMTDDKKNRVFTVTITDLRTEDEGQYWCAVKRRGPDDYSEILLKIKQDPLTPAPSPDTGSFGIIITGVLVFLLIGAVLLVVAIRKKKQTLGPVSSSTEGFHLTLREGEENEYDEGNPTGLPNSHTAQSEISAENKFHRPVNTEPADSVTNSQNLDQIYTELDASRQSHIYQCLKADSAQEESICHSTDGTID
ncbi:CMRF35-like molecule 7 isoform X2 [Chanodichthys erythropterus]|uniref:CMRF35-like molecule 7 isoform X2 n=1 Tax=Chanodichthys erythropterus TaxID=933992 RepID=UPI00351DC9F6